MKGGATCDEADNMIASKGGGGVGEEARNSASARPHQHQLLVSKARARVANNAAKVARLCARPRRVQGGGKKKKGKRKKINEEVGRGQMSKGSAGEARSRVSSRVRRRVVEGV